MSCHAFSNFDHTPLSSGNELYIIASRTFASISSSLDSSRIRSRALRPSDNSPRYTSFAAASLCTYIFASASYWSMKLPRFDQMSFSTSSGVVLATSCTRLTSSLYCFVCSLVGLTILWYCSFRSFSTSLTSPLVLLICL